MTPSLLRSALFLEAAHELGLPVLQLERIARTASHRYKSYTIPKRRGGRRLIHQPSAELKELQRWIVGRLEGILKVHDCATAYRPGRGILHNAEKHARAGAILKLDFVDFFHSIVESDVISTLSATSALTESDIMFIAKSTLFRDKARRVRCLTIGAPSSPMLSNGVCYGLDTVLQEICANSGAIYTRYADDVTISAPTKSEVVELKARIEAAIRQSSQPTIRLNFNKTVIVSRKHSMTVTGLVLGNDGRVRPSRELLRRLDSAIDRFKRGIQSSNDMSPQRLLGWLSFTQSVFSDFNFRMEAKHGRGTLQRLRLEASNHANDDAGPAEAT